MRIDETRHRLRDWTLGQAPSEGLAAQVLHAEGYADIDPSHPLGGRDGSSDAMLTKNGRTWIMAVYFPQGAVPLGAVNKKVLDDYPGVAANRADGMAFVTNQHLTRGERKALAKTVGGPLEIFHLERVVHVLDRPAMAPVRAQYLDIPGDLGGLDAAARLEELRRGSRARCVARWMAAGMSGEDAARLADDGSVGAPTEELWPTAGRPVVVWTAALGSGKSIAAERVHQRAVAEAGIRADARIPVFLRASEAEGDLQAAVRGAAVEIGEARRRGADVVVDAVDEVGIEVAGQLLEHSRVLVGTWPNTTVLLTSRPTSVLVGAPEHRALPPLGEREQRRCVELGAGREVSVGWLHSVTPEVRAVLGRPLFALLAGLWLRENEGVPRAPVELLAELGRRATAAGADAPRLRALAVRSVTRQLGPVPEAEVGRAAVVERLMLTGMVVRRTGGVAFALPALAQWFAAQSLLEGETDVESLLGAPEDLELWRYPIALAVALGSWEQSRAFLRPLLARAPGFAFRVLEVAFAQAVTFGTPAPPWREAGSQVREALESALDASGFRVLATTTDAAGRLRPMAVATEGDRVSVAFWRGEGERPDVFAWPPELSLFAADWSWGPLRMTRVGRGASWAWQWARDTFKDEVAERIKSRSLPIAPEGPLADEAVWAFGCAQLNRSILRTERLPIAPLLRHIDETIELVGSADALTMSFPGRGDHDAFAIRVYLERCVERGDDELLAPLPVSDRDPSGGMIGEFYSRERLVEIAIELYRRAIVAYRQLVDRWFAPLADQLEHRVLMPLRVVGEVYPGDRDSHRLIPSMAGWIEALPNGAADEVTVSLADRHYDFSAGGHSLAQQRRARPRAARWLTGTHGGMSFEVGRPSPVADAVYHWLARDLERLGLAGPLDGKASDTRTVWEI